MLGELNDEQIERVMRSEGIVRIGCHAEGITYVVPVSYAYDGESVIGHSADGMKVRLMRQNPEVCVEVEHVDDIANWQSVIAWGRYEELRGEEAQRALQKLVDRFPVAETGHAGYGVPQDGGRAVPTMVMFRIRLERKTGRFEKRQRARPVHTVSHHGLH
jgi:nitroimidazol reductase NimA-like FMN-containing flavoprotein (pyridoxamine 5'-phosphate oxidase superfamily)